MGQQVTEDRQCDQGLADNRSGLCGAEPSATCDLAGFNAGGYVPAHPKAVQPAAEAALKAVAGGLANTEIEVLPLTDAATAHERLENHATDGRIVLTPRVPINPTCC
ncbi:hypothetical protein [Streptomyces sp. NPDC005209]|uniref:hypothetical protein n=1 Tax=Streptomyces sp. NPDC005209 TaxID=3156715 RepID=UPI0033A74574